MSSWEGWKWGPASIIGTITLIVSLGGLLVGLGQLSGAVAEVNELRAMGFIHTERLARLETKIDLLMTSTPSKRAE